MQNPYDSENPTSFKKFCGLTVLMGILTIMISVLVNPIKDGVEVSNYQIFHLPGTFPFPTFTGVLIGAGIIALGLLSPLFEAKPPRAIPSKYQ